MVTCRAAVLYGENQPFQVEAIAVDEPREHEALVRLAASGIGYTDWHVVTGALPITYPIVAGHEGAGVVERVGERVTAVRPGDHVVLAPLPTCGRCRFCAMGLPMLCDWLGQILRGTPADGAFRLHARDGAGLGQFCLISTFSEWTVVPEASVVPIDRDLPLAAACLVGASVPAGFGAAVNRAEVRPGEAVAVFGVGGLGINAVQGAAVAGAARIIAVDPVDAKLEAADELGATHTVNPDRDDPVARILALTDGVGADKAIVTIDLVEPEHVGAAVRAVRKGGRVVVVGLARPQVDHIDVSPLDLVLAQKEIVGSIYGSANPRVDLPRYLDLYRAGKLKLDEQITRTYALDQVNEGFRDLLAGRLVRGLVAYE